MALAEQDRAVAHEDEVGADDTAPPPRALLPDAQGRRCAAAVEAGLRVPPVLFEDGRCAGIHGHVRRLAEVGPAELDAFVEGDLVGGPVQGAPVDEDPVLDRAGGVERVHGDVGSEAGDGEAGLLAQFAGDALITRLAGLGASAEETPGPGTPDGFVGVAQVQQVAPAVVDEQGGRALHLQGVRAVRGIGGARGGHAGGPFVSGDGEKDGQATGAGRGSDEGRVAGCAVGPGRRDRVRGQRSRDRRRRSAKVPPAWTRSSYVPCSVRRP